MRAVLEVVERAAPSDAPVLLTGESGTGKGVLAQVLHARSARAAHPFVVVNCPTLSEELLASELFGHARGAFTGAVRDQTGRVEAAEGGTLFLDEIGEISPGLQAKLLRFLQEKSFERIGETRTRHADVRLVAATNRDLESDVAAGRFREDLLYRLNVIEITVPPLRDRIEDVLPLARRFLEFFAREAGRAAPALAKTAEETLTGYSWPGNIRELRNAMERAVILWPAQSIEPEAFASRINAAAAGARRGATAGATGSRIGGDFSLEQIEEEHIRGVLERAPNLEAAARILGSSRRRCGGSGRSWGFERRVLGDCPAAHTAIGSVNQNSAPRSSPVAGSRFPFTPISPPCDSTSSRAIERPRPEPPGGAVGRR
jgi:NtrC-family two-component system response regulator AlgB